MTDCIIIGGGPAGLMAAGILAEKGKKVVVLEKMNKPCLKLGITGKGRCNLTNAADMREFLKNINSGQRFLKYSLYEFSNQDLMAFFEKKGVRLKIERGNRVFPTSDKSFEIVGALKDWVKNLNVKIETGVEITNFFTKNRKLTAVEFQKKGEILRLECKNVIIATGGKSYPKTGSTGDGYLMAKELGHKIVKPAPALVPLTTENKTHGLKSLKLKNINASFWQDNNKICEAFGELYFTDYGVDGPVILTLSNEVIHSLKTVGKVELSIDLKPALSHKQLKNRLIREFDNPENIILRDGLRKLLPEQLVDFCTDELNLPKDKKCAEITAEERKGIRLWLKDFRVKITGHRPIEEAIVTAGGIDLKEVEPTTMRSKIINNLFFAGEVLNIDAQTGGFNLQIAFSTGYVAGIACSK